ncbi:ribosomal protein L11 methyltransferase [Anaerovibrio lipolyticus DSM 3074]|uniref:Ribosomal protein L11 methyltransferase n=1 Tax=Anaerovibrio lipolyticus DSM 3074 TaxID=1120997 RepID=A0A1M6BGJ7_9FIRM|nr:50S ribosomal protein L11 methyltransferase [Anaerovibrio lipolyticus]SHI47842.1 ribosomal protein L11 methyltransferase [Anaerovibrio lipolyticus DSM 3074]
MKWCEISIQTTHEATELIAEIFNDLGATGVVIEDPELVNDYITSGKWDYTDIPIATETEVVTEKAYLAVDGELEGKLQTFRQEVKALEGRGVSIAPGIITTSELADEDWSDTWKQYFHTEKPGDRIVIKPSWEQYEPKDDEIVVELDPGAAFGTGTHATTSMCICELEKLVQPGMKVFDVGTGSGILSIIAAKLGAKDIQAVDYDDSVLKIVQENLEENHVENVISVAQSDLMQNVHGKANLVIANIVADIIIRLFDQLDEHLEEDGTLLTSGIIEDRIDDVINAATAHGYGVVKRMENKGWACITFKKQA